MAHKNPKQLELPSRGHGGKRKGAGRKKSKTAGVSHLKRDKIKSTYPVHLTVRLAEPFSSMRGKKGFSLFRRAVLLARKKGLNVLQFALLGNHFHLIAEVTDNKTLASGMGSLNTSLAKGLLKQKSTESICENRWGRVVLKDRYHLQRLTTPTQVRNALVYVLSNAAKHFKRKAVFDWYSSFFLFPHARKLAKVAGKYDWSMPEVSRKFSEFCATMVGPPTSWLARDGWMRAV